MNAARQLSDDDPAFEKLLSDNRERYILQSRLTKCGQVAELPRREEVNEQESWYNEDQLSRAE